MVVLKRFFHAERASPTPGSRDADIPSRSPSQRTQASGLGLSSKNAQLLDGNGHFQNIEKQFEAMHEQLQARSMPPPTHIPLSRASIRLANRNARHIDLLDALLTFQKHQIVSSGLVSPTAPYNEDVAERNMAPFLRGRQPRSKNLYSRSISPLYQEDVADRNIARNRRRSRSLTRSKSHRSYQPSCQNGGVKGRPRSKTKESQILRSTSPDSLRPIQTPQGETRASSSNDSEIPYTGRHLGVPPAYKQGDSWSNTPLPDSPTLPMTMGYQPRKLNENPRQDSPAGSTPSPRLPKTPKEQKSPGFRPRSSGLKKNVRDLSINTELAALGRPHNIAHRAIQPPTPSNLEGNQTSSIAEVMNSPLQIATPTSPALSLLPMTNQKVAEIMDMFRRAYMSTQTISPHPTFETLQDAIIREINSHEAFQRVPVPEAGPAFTPSPSQDSFDKSAPALKPSSSTSLKDGQLSRLIRKGSLKRHMRDSELRKSISTSVPSHVSRQTPSRRRHTDAPHPTPGFFDTTEPNQITGEETVTYMDLLLQTEKSTPQPCCASGLSTTPSILYMRAQTSGSDRESRASLSADDSDDEIIHLPSVGTIPQVQIHGVDENNVTYVAAENTTPRNAYRLMNWPRKSNRSVSWRSTLTRNGSASTKNRNSGLSVQSY
ncbi:hypothetical protein ARAM_005869 [Aspergillus rambellii]|uniref:Uncharacterized protein n=1 Tax=Aspergillus rambellii TaxID=308745 RepID=A0A0F8WSA4_9EURO|nr:hypothetical protein ARAM_005869 [Aspergillus rambellii]